MRLLHAPPGGAYSYSDLRLPNEERAGECLSAPGGDALLPRIGEYRYHISSPDGRLLPRAAAAITLRERGGRTGTPSVLPGAFVTGCLSLSRSKRALLIPKGAAYTRDGIMRAMDH